MRPRVGLCIPVRYSRCRDGDTVEVSLPQSAYVWAIRLADCWCREMNEPGGREAKEFAESVLDDCEELFLFLPITSPVTNIAKLLSFDRLVGELWISPTQTLNEMLVESGYATRTKAG